MWTSINSLAPPPLLECVMGQPHGRPQLLVGGIPARRGGPDCEFVGWVEAVPSQPLPRGSGSMREKMLVKSNIKGGCNELNTLS